MMTWGYIPGRIKEPKKLLKIFYDGHYELVDCPVDILREVEIDELRGFRTILIEDKKE